MRKYLELTEGWRFFKGECADGFRTDFNDEGWEVIHIPHDYSLDGPYDKASNELNVGSGDFTQYVRWMKEGSQCYLPRGKSFYRKVFALEKQDLEGKVFIEFDGVYRNSTTYFNGRKMGSHYSGYASFGYDLTTFAKEGENVLAVKLDPEKMEGWFYEGRGIYRPVRVLICNKLHIEKWGVFIITESVDKKKNTARILIKTTIRNDDGIHRRFEVLQTVFDNSGAEILQNHFKAGIPAGECNELSNSINISDPTLWYPENPYMYRLKTEIYENGCLTDQVETDFGMRTLFFDSQKGFFLNGKHYKLNGVCNHDDYAGLGCAIPERVHYINARQMREAGVLFMRGAHNQRSPEELDACDRHGILVWAETRYFADGEMDIEALSSMLRRDRNHPSVICWSMGNEETKQGSDLGVNIALNMKKVCRELDPTRPVTIAMNGELNTDNGFTDILDLNGYNWISLEKMDSDHEAYPNRCILVSEYHFGQTDDELNKRDYIAATATWTGFDYKGELNWPNLSWNGGCLWDLAHFETDAFYKFQAVNLFRLGRPVLYARALGGWRDNGDGSIGIVGYTNCEEVRLSVGGQLVKTLKMRNRNPDGSPESMWLFENDVAIHTELTYTPNSDLEISGIFNGEEAIRQVIRPQCTARKIVLVSDAEKIGGHGDVCPVAVLITDENGNVIEDNDREISFSITGCGEIIGLGNANRDAENGGAEPDKPCFNYYRKHSYRGKLRAFIRSNGEGEIFLSACCEGLESGSAVILAANGVPHHEISVRPVKRKYFGGKLPKAGEFSARITDAESPDLACFSEPGGVKCRSDSLRINFTDTDFTGFTADTNGIKANKGVSTSGFTFRNPDGQNTYNINIRYSTCDADAEMTLYMNDDISVRHLIKTDENGTMIYTAPNRFIVDGQHVRVVLEVERGSVYLEYIEFARLTRITRTDDCDSTIVYNGGWKNEEMNGAFMNTVHISQAEGDEATCVYTGSKVVVFGLMRKGQGLMEVYIDGELHGRVEGPGNTFRHAYPLFESDFLPYGEHTVRIVNRAGAGLKPAEIIFDGLEIINR